MKYSLFKTECRKWDSDAQHFFREALREGSPERGQESGTVRTCVQLKCIGPDQETRHVLLLMHLPQVGAEGATSRAGYQVRNISSSTLEMKLKNPLFRQGTHRSVIGWFAAHLHFVQLAETTVYYRL